MSQFTAAVDLEFWTILPHEFLDLSGNVAGDKLGIGPVELLQSL